MSPGSVRPRGCRDASVCRDASGELTASTAAANALNTRAGGFDWQPLTGRRCRPSTAGLEAKEASSARARRQQSAPSTAAPHDPRHVLGAGRLPRPRPGCIATSYLFSCRQPHQAHPCVAPRSICASVHALGSGARRGSHARRNSKTESRIRPAKEHAKSAECASKTVRVRDKCTSISRTCCRGRAKLTFRTTFGVSLGGWHEGPAASIVWVLALGGGSAASARAQ